MGNGAANNGLRMDIARVELYRYIFKILIHVFFLQLLQIYDELLAISNVYHIMVVS